MKINIKIAVVPLLVAFLSAPLFAQAGADTYKAKCQMCHAKDGTGNTPAGKSMRAKPFTDPEIVHKSDADLITVVKNGQGKMPSYNGKLTDGQIEDVVAYIRTLQKK